MLRDIGIQTNDLPSQCSQLIECKITNSMNSVPDCDLDVVELDDCPKKSKMESRDSDPIDQVEFRQRQMQNEIQRLDLENKRLRLLIAFTRAEMALDHRNRLAELRKIWDAELESIMESACQVWEQDVIQIVKAVKQKQWASLFCGFS